MSPFLHRRLTDEQLGRRLASGEAAAFDELYRRYAHRLAAYGANLLGDGPAGDDVAQTALLRAYAALRDGRIPGAVRPWLYRIAHNVAIDLVRRRREWPTATLPEAPAAAAGEGGALVAALATLPERQRNVYVLRELHGLRIDETAAELGLASAQVEQALFAARNRLAEHLVFGERLDCVAVQRLAAGPLATDERRALKTHLRSCAACRSSLGARGRALASLPTGALEWLRGAIGLGAPAAAKLGAVVAGASVAAGVPVALERNPPHRLPAIPVAATRHAAPRAKPARVVLHPVVRSSAPVPTPQPVVSAPRPVPSRVPRRETERPRRESEQRSVPAPATATRVDDGGSSGRDGGGDNAVPASTTPAVSPSPAVTTVETAPPTVTSDDHGGSSSTDGGHDGTSPDGAGGDGGGLTGSN